LFDTTEFSDEQWSLIPNLFRDPAPDPRGGRLRSILSLHAQSWPARRIARDLGVDRATVRKYGLGQSYEAKPANLPTGSDRSKPAYLPMPPGAASEPAGNLPTAAALS